MKTLNLSEINKVSGGLFFDTVSTIAGGILGAAAASKLGDVTLASLQNVVIPEVFVVLSGAIVGASLCYGATRSVSPYGYNYY